MINRRSLIAAAGAALILPPLRASPPPAKLRLWPTTPPGGGGPSGVEQVSDKGAVANIAMPTLEVFVPARPNGTAMLVAAGGGYKRIENEKEARPAARWLAARGITAFVLTYRLPIEDWRAGPLAPLQDAQRALRLIRANAERYRIDPAKVGALGFSAGGHLLGLAAGRSAFASYPTTDQVDALPAIAAAVALAYPVITLMPPHDNTSTRRSLVGQHPTPEASAEWSVETHVRSHYPTTFLVQAQDDPISDPANTVIMAEACRRAGIPVELHQPATGGHGFAMGRSGTPTDAWPSWLEAWLRRTRLLPAA
jgi:acetyl esterase/lipase